LNRGHYENAEPIHNAPRKEDRLVASPTRRFPSRVLDGRSSECTGFRAGTAATNRTRYMRFFLIDRITRWEIGQAAEAVKNVALSEDFFDDHFPSRPVMPGVLILEGMAQLSGLLLEASLRAQYAKDAKAVLTVIERTKFREMAKPGDALIYRTQMVSVNELGGKVAVQALRDGQIIAESGMVFAFKYVDDPRLDQKRTELLSLWMRPD
jgi:3-hydroxyacyl-[acyl-carrier-protein] dehydratase